MSRDKFDKEIVGPRLEFAVEPPSQSIPASATGFAAHASR